jgi:hypothetical protein
MEHRVGWRRKIIDEGIAMAETCDDGLCKARVALEARQLPGLVCAHAGIDCPLIEKGRAEAILALLKKDPAVTIRLKSNADEIPRYTSMWPECYARLDAGEVVNRKRDLDVLQRLGLAPGDTRRGRYLFELLFSRIATVDGLCAFNTPGWEGCAHARSGGFEKVRDAGWKSIVYSRSEESMREARGRSSEQIAKGGGLYVRPHHLMCLACGYAGGKNDAPRPNDTLYEILERIRREPDVPITLVEGTCQACDCCDGFYPETGRCVHGGGLIRDYKKDLDCFQKLGLMPGATVGARALFKLLFERIPSTRGICAYGDGVVTSEEWRICSEPDGNPGYEATRDSGVFG